MSLKPFFILILTAFCGVSAFSNKATQYPASDIPKEMQVQADAVIRVDETTVELKGKAVVEKKRTVVTVLNQKGNSYAVLRVFYNSFSSVSKISGDLYDGDGKFVRGLKKDKITDISTFGSSFVFHDDSRVKLYDFDCKQYPYTVVFEYEVRSNNNFFLPYWNPQESGRVAVMASEFSLRYPSGIEIMRKGYDLPENVDHEVDKQEHLTIESWKLSNIKPTEIQPKAPGHLLPLMAFVPQKVYLSGFSGDASSWQGLGSFLFELNSGRDELPEEIRAKANNIVSGLSSDKEKIEALYRFMQSSTRYVANEYGIGGWQTFKASEVARLSYGDCKGLSNYMKALLKAVNIPSYLAVINAGTENVQKTDVDFVRNHFNHMILCVPLPNDTVWLECTSSSNPSGYLGAFTQNRKALMLTENGGYLVNTPRYGKNHNQIDRSVEIHLDPLSDRSTIYCRTDYVGLMQDDLHSVVRSGSLAKIKNRLKHTLPYSDYELLSHEYEFLQRSDVVPAIKEIVELKVSDLMDRTTKRLLVTIPIERFIMADLGRSGKRTLPFELDKDVKLRSQYKVYLPDGYEMETLPQEITIERPFASLKTTVSKEGDVLLVNFDLEQHGGTYDAALFNDYMSMIDRTKLQLSSIAFTMLKL